MKNTTIDARLLPNMWLTWETTKGTFYLDCTAGKKYSRETLPFTPKRYGDPSCRTINSGSKPRFAYAKYHDDIKRLELAEVTIDTTRKEMIHEWRYSGPKYFLGKDKSVIDENGNEVFNNFKLSQYHRSHDFKGYLGMFYRISCFSNVDEFKKFLGSDTYTVGSGRCVTVSNCWHMQEWYKTKQKVRGPGREQKLTDSLVAMKVTDINIVIDKYFAELNANRTSYYGRGMIYFEKLENGWSVLRIMHKGYYDNKVIEKERIYLHDDGRTRIVAPSKDCWVPSRANHVYGRYVFVNKEEAKQKCNRLKYILPLLENSDESNIKTQLINILRFPEIEQMISLGYTEPASAASKSHTPKADLKFMFGGYYNEKGKTLLKKAGLTKYQFDKHMMEYAGSRWYSGYRADALRELRKFFGDGMVHVDKETFDKYYDAFTTIYSQGRWSALFKELDDMNIDRNKFIKNIVRLGERNEHVYNVVRDTMRQYNQLNTGTKPEINWFFDSYSDLVRAHDAIDELKREQDAERRAMWDLEEAERRKKEEKKRAEVDKERQKYEYEDDTYIIRLPKDCNEIIQEGSMQRICIGGYTTSHATGKTNLFFLRRKSDPDTPFYAIEMNNNNVITQIHGYANSWLGKHPEAIPTVIRWLRKNGIKCRDQILTCTSNGYCATNNYVSMPVVD